MDPDLNLFFGEDFGRTGDLTVIWVLQEQADLKLTSPLVLELRNIPFDQQKQLLFFVIDNLPRFQFGALDARGNGHDIAESAVLRYGSQAESIMLSPRWYLDNMARVKAHFEDQTVTVPKDADILSDLRAIRMDKGVAKIPDNARKKGGDGFMRHGDAAIALALAVYASVQDIEIFGYEAVNDHEYDSKRIMTTHGFKGATGRWRK